ncbi:MAG TPA: thioredoxin domain-containing protein [Polyangiaceae bacterium]|nr:thioredoxin domain-containing protein [Polyangiaceae bacterium]
MSSKALAVAGLVALLSSRLTTCRSPGEGGGDASQPHSEQAVQLKGIDTSSLTARERSDWSESVSHLMSPCPDQAVSLAQCVNENRPCRACQPAVRLLLAEVRRGRTQSQIETSYRDRFSPDRIKNIDLNDTPSKGPANAPIVIVEFADFECPACGATQPLLDQLYEAHQGQVRFFYKHYPLPMHPNADKAARAAVAAMRQGKFWEMHAVLFKNQTALGVENVEKLAQGIGLDMARFRQDRDAEATADFVAKNRKQGEALELTGTPSIFINGRKFSSTGENQAQDLEDWLSLELELTGNGSAPAASVVPVASATPQASAAPAAPAASAAKVAPAAAAGSSRPASSAAKAP